MHRSVSPRLTIALAVSVSLTALLVSLLMRGLALEATHPALSLTVLILFAINTLVLSLSAVLAVAGLRHDTTAEATYSNIDPGPCAVLWLVCGEPPEPLAARLSEFLDHLEDLGERDRCDVFILSDTQDVSARAHEKQVFEQFGSKIIYRNRPQPKGRKPGNLHDWLQVWGAQYETMLVLDADSGFSAERLSLMRRQMAANPRLGLLQAAIRMRPTRSRFGAMQRLSARLSGPVFARGLAWLTADCGNFWGHNALIRTKAFSDVAPLPQLAGRAPFGGPILSHDFIEAAYLRRAGWDVALCSDSRGSFEDAPDTIAAHLRRDRRWAQGNLQHLRLIAAPGLHLASRLHLALGIHSYLAAPIWLALILLTGSGAIHATVGVIWPLLGVLFLLIVPKVAGLHLRRSALKRPALRRVLMRALWAELALSTLFAPIGMVRRSGFVGAIVSGRSVGWVPFGHASGPLPRPGQIEAATGAAITVAVALPQMLIAGPVPALVAATLVLPVTLPLISAPYLWPWFDRARPDLNTVEQYYDASTRRFLAVGRSGEALAIHRPLWADGVRTHTDAAAYINSLIADQAEAALGRPPERVVDLGCGVGGTVFHLAQKWPDALLCGITISAEQVRLAQMHGNASALDARCSFLRSDFTLPMTLPRADLVVAVESHVHAPSATQFLQSALRHLRPGGVLVLVDDMLTRPETALTARETARLAQFRSGWRLGHVPDCEGLVARAQAMGFSVATVEDLTRYLHLGRLRDHALSVVGPVADLMRLSRWPLFGNMIGGNALTQSYRAGQMRYTMLVLQSPVDADQKPATPLPAEAVA